MPITTLFLDVGGVRLSNGWDHHARRRVARHFHPDWAEMEQRHRLTFETHEGNAYRIHQFKLNALVDSFFSSCFVHLRKPDAEIFRLALNVVQAPARQIVYIEDTPMFVAIAEGLGIRSILHRDYASTGAELAALGLQYAT